MSGPPTSLPCYLKQRGKQALTTWWQKQHDKELQQPGRRSQSWRRSSKNKKNNNLKLWRSLTQFIIQKTSRDLQHIALCFQPPCKKNSGTRLTGGTGDLLERSIFGGEKTNKSLRQSQEPGWWRCCSLWHHKGQTSTLGGKRSRQKMQWMKFSFVYAECADQVHVQSFVWNQRSMNSAQRGIVNYDLTGEPILQGLTRRGRTCRRGSARPPPCARAGMWAGCPRCHSPEWPTASGASTRRSK